MSQQSFQLYEQSRSSQSASCAVSLSLLTCLKMLTLAHRPRAGRPIHTWRRPNRTCSPSPDRHLPLYLHLILDHTSPPELHCSPTLNLRRISKRLSRIQDSARHRHRHTLNQILIRPTHLTRWQPNLHNRSRNQTLSKDRLPAYPRLEKVLSRHRLSLRELLPSLRIPSANHRRRRYNDPRPLNSRWL